MNKRDLLARLDGLMHEAIAEGRIAYTPGAPQTELEYEGATLRLTLSFDCLDRTYRRVRDPSRNAKMREGKRLITAAEKFSKN